MNPDGRDPGGGFVLLATGPATFVRWYHEHGRKVGRQLRRSVFLPRTNRIAMSTQAGPSHLGLFRWEPEGTRVKTVTVETPRTSIVASAGTSSQHREWIDNPWRLAAPGFGSNEQTNMSSKIASLIHCLAGLTKAAPVEIMGTPDVPLLDSMLDAAEQLQAHVPMETFALKSF